MLYFLLVPLSPLLVPFGPLGSFCPYLSGRSSLNHSKSYLNTKRASLHVKSSSYNTFMALMKYESTKLSLHLIKNFKWRMFLSLANLFFKTYKKMIVKDLFFQLTQPFVGLDSATVAQWAEATNWLCFFPNWKA